MTALTRPATLAECTTLGLGGPARRFLEAASEAQLIAAVRDADERGDPALVLGGGSNLVISDAGFDGTVIRVATRGVRIWPAGAAVSVTAAAGEDWDALTERCVSEDLAGVECLGGIPGLAGATPVQNVGAYGQEVADVITTVRVYDRARREVAELGSADCGFGYRTSRFKRSTGWRPGRPATAAPGSPPGAQPASPSPTGRFVVLSVTLALLPGALSQPVRYAELAAALGVSAGGRVPLGQARAAVLALRRAKGMVLDPADPDTRSAGSFFTNPVLTQDGFRAVQRAAWSRLGPAASVPSFPAGEGRLKVPAAWLIERAGFGKGYSGGPGARISFKHTLALVNPGGGSTAALLALAAEIRDGVCAAFGVELVPEPVLVGVSL